MLMRTYCILNYFYTQDQADDERVPAEGNLSIHCQLHTLQLSHKHSLLSLQDATFSLQLFWQVILYYFINVVIQGTHFEVLTITHFFTPGRN